MIDADSASSSAISTSCVASWIRLPPGRNRPY